VAVGGHGGGSDWELLEEDLEHFDVDAVFALGWGGSEREEKEGNKTESKQIE
jgi:hypothetical protein